MKTKSTQVEDTVHELRNHFRPHQRVQYTGTLINHKTGEIFTPPRRTKQSHVAECDINNILKQYKLTGQIAHIRANASMGAYTDLPDDSDFQTALNTVLAGQAAFATLPAKTRDRFGNDPAKFLEFMADPVNGPEAVELGLATARLSEQTTQTSPSHPPETTSKTPPPNPTNSPPNA